MSVSIHVKMLGENPHPKTTCSLQSVRYPKVDHYAVVQLPTFASESMKTAVFNLQNASVDVVALVNDTTGTMMSCAFNNPDVSAGLILGTGTNACYMESLDNVPKWTGDQNDPREVIINTEWGAFGDNGSWNHLRTAFDEKVDRESINPGMQL